MQTKFTYKGTLNGISGIWCGFKPKGVEVEEKITVYYPDEGKVFKKGDELFQSVVLQENEVIEDYQEIDNIEPTELEHSEEVPAEEE